MGRRSQGGRRGGVGEMGSGGDGEGGEGGEEGEGRGEVIVGKSSLALGVWAGWRIDDLIVADSLGDP